MTTKATQESKSITDFAWDEKTPEVNFFGETSPESSTEVIETVVTDDIESADDKPKPDDKPKDDEPVHFFNEEEEEDEEEDEGSDDKKPLGKFVNTLSSLKSKGIIDFTLEDGQELTEELAETLLEDKFEESIEARVSELLKGLPDVLKDMTRYTLDGGDINTFLANISTSSNTVINENLDMTEPANQELVMREMLKEEGYDNDYIQTNIDFLKDSGKLEKFASAKFSKWIADKQENDQALLQQQATAKANEKERIRKLKSTVATKLTTLDNINGVGFSKDEIKELPSYMADKTVKMKDGSQISQMQSDLLQALSNEEHAILLAKLLKSQFDFESIKKEAKSKVVEEVRRNIRSNSSSVPASSGQGSSHKSGKSLHEYF